MEFNIPNPGEALNKSISDHLQNQMALSQLAQQPARQAILESQAKIASQELQQQEKTRETIKRTMLQQADSLSKLSQAEKLNKFADVMMEEGNVEGAMGLYKTSFELTHQQTQMESQKEISEARTLRTNQQALDYGKELMKGIPVGDQERFNFAVSTFEDAVNRSRPPGSPPYISPYRGRIFTQDLKDEIDQDLMTANQRAVSANNKRIQDRKDREEVDVSNYRQARIAKTNSDLMRDEEIRKNGGYTPKQKADAENSLRDDARAELVPIVKNLRSARNIRGLLETGTSAGDKQVHAALTGFIAEVRATNYLYADNKNYGDLVDRVIGWVSKEFQGTYSEHERAEIGDMLDEFENNVLIPQYKTVTSTYYKSAKRKGLDPAAILPADVFNLEGVTPPTPSSSAPRGGGKNPGNKLWADIGKEKRDKFMGALLRNKSDPEYRRVFKEKFGFLPSGINP